MRKGRGPNLMPAFCKDCGALLNWKNHFRYYGLYCRTHYREQQKIRKGLMRKPLSETPPKEKNG